ncbi:MAG: hypothetical protein A3G18_01025 [Rhodospirillales bacterium RIFCSPLOWO2_12_FULL_58_28]|nr:MAG: hypothetical protein A3H92_04230 [Rhodospirillales bacterium RIFCSPLOWO2_02_FULL_58_16]OHC77988.1 MAG: hypothetical protein A3G18_01025 [Rhodospirillales bacterium RIFCSPLOWO2_12_FULL_58_28]
MTHKLEVDALRKELLGLFHYIQRVREELVSIERDSENVHQFESMSDQLDAIVAATEEATETIMGAMEGNDEAVAKLRAGITDAALLAQLDKIEKNGQNVFEACSFQDITGQRVTKIAKSVTYVEKKVTALMDIWGKEELEKIEVKPEGGHKKTEDEKLLNGPQLDSENKISQAEIDALFA